MNVKTYILHCKKLSNRFTFMNEQINTHRFTDVVWYTDHDASDQVGEDLNGIYEGVRPQNVEKLKIYNEYSPRILNAGEISLSTKWGKVIKIIADSDDVYALVLEDDALLCRNFSKLFQKYIDSTPSDWDMIYLGDGCNLHANYTEGKHAYLKEHPASRCSDSVLIKKTAAEKISTTWFPFDHGADFELSWQQYHHDLNVYWWEPTLVTQESQGGRFTSTLNH
jgi:GR25 family glycosyltransferase involved in LPS biosynthesis